MRARSTASRTSLLSGMQSASLLCDSASSAEHRQGEFMSTDRGRRRTVKITKDHRASRSRHTVRLAPGVRVDGDGEHKAVFVLVCADGKVQLNSAAVAILKLCDGSRDRDGIVAELMRGAPRRALADEIVEFLDAALARGWIIDV
jgi:pyrroloquinoline quinone biosynthesis protein D